MFKYIFLCCLLVSSIFAKSIQFSEAKYVDALGKTFQKSGKITFAKNSMQIDYADKTSLFYSGDFVISTKGTRRKKIDLKKNPSIKMFFLLFEAIYFNKKSLFTRYFDQEKKQGVVILTPHKTIHQYIESVHYKKTAKKLNFLEIYMSNKDRIRIEERD
jgi:hypothetical protein